MGKRIGSLFWEIGADDTKFSDALQRTKSSAQTAKADMQKLADQTTRLGGDFRQTGGIVDDWIGSLRASTPENMRFAASVENITTQFSNGKLSAAEAADQLEAVKREMRDSAPAAEKFKTALHGVSNAIAGITGAAAIVGVTVKKIFDFGEEGAKLEYAQGKFDNLAASIGTTSDALKNDLRGATKGLVADSELVASAGDLMALGLAKTHDEVVRLTRVAGALGMDMNQLVLTLTNQTTMRFDALGVSVDGFDEKVKALEQSGLDAGAAFKEAFLQQAEEQIGKIGDKADSGAAAFARMETAIKNAGDAIKVKLAPPLEDAANAIVRLLTWEKDLTNVMSEHEKAVRTSEKGWEAYASEMIRVGVAAGYYNDIQAEQMLNTALQKGDLEGLIDIFNQHGYTVEYVTEEEKKWIDAVEGGTVKVQTYSDAVAETSTQLDDAAVSADSFKVKLEGLDDIDPQFGNKIETAIEQAKIALAGGAPIQEAIDQLLNYSATVDPEDEWAVGQIKTQLENAVVAAQEVQVEAGLISGDEAAQNISDTLGISLEDAKQRAIDIKDELGTFPKSIDVFINYIESGNRSSDPYNIKDDNDRGDTYANGGQFVIPPGYEDHSWPVGPGRYAESGETVTITPQGESSAAGMTIIQNIYTQLDYEVAAAEIMERIRRER